jgi:DNA-binding FadR family transcriptional regulator
MRKAGQKQSPLQNSGSTKPSVARLEYDILQTISAHGRPVGSWTVHFVLRERGYTVSAPTIGRRLRDLEKRGMLSPATIEGRSLTPAGEELLKRTDEEHLIQMSTGKLLLSLERNSRKDLIDQLIVRRAIEGESAALAAQNVSSRTLVSLGRIIEDQRLAIRRGEMGVNEDVRFHETLAQASGNSVLASIVHLLRSHPRFNHLINAIRTKVGGQRIIDHEEILSAITRRDASLARRAMERHITKLIDDVEQYWEQVFSDLGTQTVQMDEGRRV